MTNVRYTDCGLLNFASAGECKRCHKPLDAGGAGEGDAGWWRAEASADSDDTPRCGFCGYETAAQYCPRCKARITQPEASSFNAHGSPRGSGGGRAVRWLVVLAVVVAAGFGGYAYRHRVAYGPGAEFALAILDSEQFNEPVVVKAKKRVTLGQHIDGPSLAGPDRSDPVYVLKEHGLVEFGEPVTEERVTGTYAPLPPPTLFSRDDDDAPAPEPVEIKSTYYRSTVALTTSGRRLADDWEDTDDGAWLVPVASREFYRVDKVGEVEEEAGVETLDVEFSWNWVPNGVGEAFDVDGKVFHKLSEDARVSVLGYNWGSAKVYRAVAHFERRGGGAWRIVGMEKSENVNGKTELSDF